MPRISYALINGKGEWHEVTKDHSDQLILRFYPQKDGYIVIDNTVYRVKCGEVNAPLSKLRDAEYALRLECGNEGFTLEKFRKSGADIVMPKTDEATVRSLVQRCYKNEERIKTLEDKLATIIKMTEGHRIFN